MQDECVKVCPYPASVGIQAGISRGLRIRHSSGRHHSNAPRGALAPHRVGRGDSCSPQWRRSWSQLQTSACYKRATSGNHAPRLGSFAQTCGRKWWRRCPDCRFCCQCSRHSCFFEVNTNQERPHTHTLTLSITFFLLETGSPWNERSTKHVREKRTREKKQATEKKSFTTNRNNRRC